MDEKIAEKKASLEKKLAELEAKKKGLAEKAISLKKRIDELEKHGTHLTSKQQTQFKILYGDAAIKMCQNDEALALLFQTYLKENTHNRKYRRILGFQDQDQEKIQKIEPKKKNLFEQNPIPARERINLKTTFEDKEKVKALGAKWDGNVWYVPKGEDLRPFQKWLPEHINLTKYQMY